MKAFNKCLSGIQIGVEHAFGMLKGYFGSLKEMWSHADIQEMYKAIEVLLVLHNMCIEYGDKPEDIWGYDPKDDFDDEEAEDLENGDGMILDDGEGIPARDGQNEWLYLMTFSLLCNLGI